MQLWSSTLVGHCNSSSLCGWNNERLKTGLEPWECRHGSRRDAQASANQPPHSSGHMFQFYCLQWHYTDHWCWCNCLVCNTLMLSAAICKHYPTDLLWSRSGSTLGFTTNLLTTTDSSKSTCKTNRGKHDSELYKQFSDIQMYNLRQMLLHHIKVVVSMGACTTYNFADKVGNPRQSIWELLTYLKQSMLVYFTNNEQHRRDIRMMQSTSVNTIKGCPMNSLYARTRC